jgi:glycerol-3-phosphate dehydrogenase
MSAATRTDRVVVIGGGVVGCAVARELSRRGVATTLVEALADFAHGASGSNSGILHTGFDSPAGELETRLIRRSAELREELLQTVSVPLVRCGALMSARDEPERNALAALHENATAGGVETSLAAGGSLQIDGESVTDPVAFTKTLAGCASASGAELRLNARVISLTAQGGLLSLGLAGEGQRLQATAVVNCAGLFADEVAALAGGEPFAIYPRKGEFIVFDGDGLQLERILLPVPSAMGKGVLVFPTTDGHVIAGPTAREREDKHDCSVEAGSIEELHAMASERVPSLADLRPIASYAGLRPAGRERNYVIEFSDALPQMLHVAAIRSTGLSASLGIAEHVAGMLSERDLIEPSAALLRDAPAQIERATLPWWREAAERSRHASEGGTA